MPMTEHRETGEDGDVTDERWTRLREAEPSLVAAFRSRGVVRADYVAAFPHPDVWVWLGTATDAQREALAADAGLVDEVRQVLNLRREAGITIEGVTVQSEETVARDYDGRWFYALR
jgi:hypothetical protein